jgi:surfeit locus 1 family protein
VDIVSSRKAVVHVVTPLPHIDTPSIRPDRSPFRITVAGVVGTLVLAAVIIIFARLGFWQLARLEERRELNEGVAARLDAPPVASPAALEDTVGLFYRVATVRGTLDDEGSIVLPGRSHRGVPGVYLLTPLLLEDRRDAVLVNRGWVPSADGATIDISDFAVAGPVTVRGLVLPFPGATQSLAPAERLRRPEGGGFRRVWFAVDEPSLRAQYPYSLLPVTLQELPPAAGEAAAPKYPTRLEPPPLDEGPHFGYALQWFSFALIGIIGWFALVLRGRSGSGIVAPPLAGVLLLLGGVLLLGAPQPAAAQLRPLDPMEWRAFDGAAWIVAGAGLGVLWDQPASLAGTRGRLLEAGTYAVTVRSGRIAVSFSGVAVWRLSDEVVEQPPAEPAQPPTDRPRQEAGGAAAATLVRVSPDAWPVDVVIRFGATIPTTSDESGLDRDRTDFFALAGARYRRGPLTLAMENGIGINGTIHPSYPQSDVWAYAFGASYAFRPGTVVAELVGHQDGHSRTVRGNEDQCELRFGLDTGRRYWVRARYVHGLGGVAPGHGLRLSVGLSLD